MTAALGFTLKLPTWATDPEAAPTAVCVTEATASDPSNPVVVKEIPAAKLP